MHSAAFQLGQKNFELAVADQGVTANDGEMNGPLAIDNTVVAGIVILAG